jgi:uncharacterized protein (DUF983 family)
MSLDLKECPHCKVGHTEQTYIDNLKVCPNCGYHMSDGNKPREMR